MGFPSQTVKAFINDSYQLVSANSPTVPLQGNDQSKGFQFLNELLNYFAGNGLKIITPKEISFEIAIGQTAVTFTDPSYTGDPTSDPVIKEGRLANLQNAWLLLDGVTYPMYDESRNTFKASYKYDPLKGLPRFAIPTYYDDYTYLRIYPAPSQVFTCFIFGKFQLENLDINGTMAELPSYYIRFLRLALARELAFYKGRASAWTQDLKDLLKESDDEIIAMSPVNLNIESDYESLLNGAWRVRAGV